MEYHHDYRKYLNDLMRREYLNTIERNALLKAHGKIEQYEMGMISDKQCQARLDDLIERVTSRDLDKENDTGKGLSQARFEADKLQRNFNRIKEVMER